MSQETALATPAWLLILTLTCPGGTAVSTIFAFDAPRSVSKTTILASNQINRSALVDNRSATIASKLLRAASLNYKQDS